MQKRSRLSVPIFACLAICLPAICAVTGLLAAPPELPGSAPGAGAPAGPQAPSTPDERPSGKRRHHPKGPGSDDPGPAAQVMGRAFCSAPACHGALVKEFNGLRHSHYVSDPKLKDEAGCEVCHGPASDHVGDPNHRKIWRFAVQSPENSRRVNEACMRCHQNDVDQAHFQATEHSRAGMSCATCHEVHYDLKMPYMLRYAGLSGPAGQPIDPGAKTKKAKAPTPIAVDGTAPASGAGAAPPAGAHLAALSELGIAAMTRVPLPEWRTTWSRDASAVTDEQAVNELCASCHRHQLAETRQFSHHPVFEGRVKCTDCHDPHRAVEGKMLRKSSVEDTCLQCHQEIRGPFVDEHEPVKAGGLGEGCLECHRPHGSPNPKLEVLFSRGLCIQCHSDIQREPTHRYRTGDCWRGGCHTAIHGSNHSVYLLRD